MSGKVIIDDNVVNPTNAIGKDTRNLTEDFMLQPGCSKKPSKVQQSNYFFDKNVESSSTPKKTDGWKNYEAENNSMFRETLKNDNDSKHDNLQDFAFNYRPTSPDNSVNMNSTRRKKKTLDSFFNDPQNFDARRSENSRSINQNNSRYSERFCRDPSISVSFENMKDETTEKNWGNFDPEKTKFESFLKDIPNSPRKKFDNIKSEQSHKSIMSNISKEKKPPQPENFRDKSEANTDEPPLIKRNTETSVLKDKIVSNLPENIDKNFLREKNVSNGQLSHRHKLTDFENRDTSPQLNNSSLAYKIDFPIKKINTSDNIVDPDIIRNDYTPDSLQKDPKKYDHFNNFTLDSFLNNQPKNNSKRYNRDDIPKFMDKNKIFNTKKAEKKNPVEEMNRKIQSKEIKEPLTVERDSRRKTDSKFEPSLNKSLNLPNLNKSYNLPNEFITNRSRDCSPICDLTQINNDEDIKSVSNYIDKKFEKKNLDSFLKNSQKSIKKNPYKIDASFVSNKSKDDRQDLDSFYRKNNRNLDNFTKKPKSIDQNNSHVSYKSRDKSPKADMVSRDSIDGQSLGRNHSRNNINSFLNDKPKKDNFLPKYFTEEQNLLKEKSRKYSPIPILREISKDKEDDDILSRFENMRTSEGRHRPIDHKHIYNMAQNAGKRGSRSSSPTNAPSGYYGKPEMYQLNHTPGNSVGRDKSPVVNKKEQYKNYSLDNSGILKDKLNDIRNNKDKDKQNKFQNDKTKSPINKSDKFISPKQDFKQNSFYNNKKNSPDNRSDKPLSHKQDFKQNNFYNDKAKSPDSKSDNFKSPRDDILSSLSKNYKPLLRDADKERYPEKFDKLPIKNFEHTIVPNFEKLPIKNFDNTIRPNLEKLPIKNFENSKAQNPDRQLLKNFDNGIAPKPENSKAQNPDRRLIKTFENGSALKPEKPYNYDDSFYSDISKPSRQSKLDNFSKKQKEPNQVPPRSIIQPFSIDQFIGNEIQFDVGDLEKSRQGTLDQTYSRYEDNPSTYRESSERHKESKLHESEIRFNNKLLQSINSKDEPKETRLPIQISSNLPNRGQKDDMPDYLKYYENSKLDSDRKDPRNSARKQDVFANYPEGSIPSTDRERDHIHHFMTFNTDAKAQKIKPEFKKPEPIREEFKKPENIREESKKPKSIKEEFKKPKPIREETSSEQAYNPTPQRPQEQISDLSTATKKPDKIDSLVKKNKERPRLEGLSNIKPKYSNSKNVQKSDRLPQKKPAIKHELVIGPKTTDRQINFDDGTCYEGDYSDNTMNGQGTFYYKDNEFYHGMWANGKKVHFNQ